MQPENKSLVAARAYLARGLGVFPLNGKVPTTRHGVKDASTDEAQIVEWFSHHPRNIAIAIPPGALVVDVDPRNGGMDTWLDWTNSYPSDCWSTAPCARTGAGGMHFWFSYDGRKLKKNPGPGVDLLTHGRYVVAPPSSTIETYKWEVALPADLAQLDDAPGWLLVLGTPEPAAEFDSNRSYSDGDELNEAAHKMTTWGRLLQRQGWTQFGGVLDQKWRHPASENDVSATITHDCLFVYSPNTPFPVTEPGDPHGVTLFSALVTLDYGGDMKRCLQALRDAGHLPPLLEAVDVDVLVPDKAKAPEEAPERTAPLMLKSLAGTTPLRARWLWHERMALGALTLLAGREGEGKSTIALELIARTTRGELDGEYEGAPKDAVIVATEDSYAHTIVPRLLAARADLDRVYRVEAQDVTHALLLPADLVDLEAACVGHDVALIVLDPLLSRLSGRLDSHKDADVRRALEPLGEFAGDMGAAVGGLIHLNKSGSTDPLTAVMASKAFTAFARSVLFAMVDPDDETRRLLGLVKSNLGRLDLPTKTYTFDPVIVGDDDGPIVATRVKWGADVTISIRSALEVAPESRSAIDDAVEFLSNYLEAEGGSATKKAVLTEARKVDIKTATLSRARVKLGIESKSAGYPRTTVWYVPAVSVVSEEPVPLFDPT